MWSLYKKEKVKTYMILSNSFAFIQLYGPKVNTDESVEGGLWRICGWIYTDGSQTWHDL